MVDIHDNALELGCDKKEERLKTALDVSLARRLKKKKKIVGDEGCLL